MSDDISHQQIIDAITGSELRIKREITQELTTMLRQELGNEIGGLRQEFTTQLTSEIGSLRQELQASIQQVTEGITEQLDVISGNMVTKADLRAISRL